MVEASGLPLGFLRAGVNNYWDILRVRTLATSADLSGHCSDGGVSLMIYFCIYTRVSSQR